MYPPFEMNQIFSKPALDLDEQVAKYKSRGLLVDNEDWAKDRLRFIGYYRLSAYALPFQLKEPDKPFKTGTHFSDIVRIYEFDRKLRLLLMDALERIEVAFRANLVNETCIAFDRNPTWFMDPESFRQDVVRVPAKKKNGPHTQRSSNYYELDYAKVYATLIKKIEEAVNVSKSTDGTGYLREEHQEVFINHYYKNYGSPYLPPFWMVAEIMPFGSISKVYDALRNPLMRGHIAAVFNVHETVMKSWLEALTYMRNLCAHHCRLWNRVFSITPMVPNRIKPSLEAIGANTSSNRFFIVATVLFDLLSTIDDKTKWNQRLVALLDEHPFIDPFAMGFPEKWREHHMWKSET